MAGLVGLICAVLVSTTAVLLKPKRLANIAQAQELRMQEMLSALPGLESVLRQSGADTLTSIVIDLDSGIPASEEVTQLLAADTDISDPVMSRTLEKAQDIARIRNRPNYVTVHMLQKNNQLELLVLPVYGTGYQSTIKAWLTLAGDLDTIVALAIYEQGETPGIGAKITEQSWLDGWPEKKLHNATGDIAISVVKGRSTNANEVDGISGATRTGQGINTMLSFWLSDLGFARFLDTIRNGNISMGQGLGKG